MRKLAVVGVLALSACGVSLGSAGLIAPQSDVVGLKVLRPGAVGRSCRASVLGVPLRAGAPDLREALGEILALDPEGDVVTHVEVGWAHLVTGVYNRRCVEVRGDLARVIPVIKLPAPEGHEGHGPH